MIRIKVIGRGGSAYMKYIRDQLGNLRITNCHAAINWGLQGEKLAEYRNRYPQIQRLPMLNEKQFGNKFDCVQAVRQAGVSTPDTVRLGDIEGEDGWIAKPYYSLGGRDIFRLDAEHRGDQRTHYAQKEITNRRYEMRVHCAAWRDPSDWIFQKRVHEDGENQLTWNHHTGGRFVTVNEPTDPLHDRLRKATKTIMRVLGYSFGAVDFIIKNPGERGQPLEHYFIEFNLAPGWTLDRIRDWYQETFEKLEDLTVDDIKFMIEGAQFNGQNGFELGDMPAVNPPDEVEDVNEELLEQVENAVPEEPEHVEVPQARVAHDFVQPIPEARPEPVDLRQAVDTIAGRDRQRAELAGGFDMEAEEARMIAALEEAMVEANFCHGCGRGINADIFGALPRFCPGCGQQVRA